MTHIACVLATTDWTKPDSITAWANTAQVFDQYVDIPSVTFQMDSNILESSCGNQSSHLEKNAIWHIHHAGHSQGFS